MDFSQREQVQQEVIDAMQANARSSSGNPAMVVLVCVVGTLLAFLVGNTFLYYYAQQKFPSKKKKTLGKKQIKRRALKNGLQMPSD
mmetsp:Transcript_38902/g.74535  ORF Transcript_38902/g.74535 Transcript_38902/m.74535 type:complete len:86 (+) Transcript_38902:100-357(+)|eukprot:CAMPEP_0114225830 /NCGR_PEP_ID=MMETSP0058-20121206/892_1 /TAXON_ID=36894 /ORGANISM="Pyramimonas parkeae, CCMP726" /LENGTH=85 /DNA_ID=CAMNT_0001336483 /DNA_START=75 /DNA_END=332 /DNA_ORIENTATION=+